MHAATARGIVAARRGHALNSGPWQCYSLDNRLEILTLAVVGASSSSSAAPVATTFPPLSTAGPIGHAEVAAVTCASPDGCNGWQLGWLYTLIKPTTV
eukprot:SAG11_NODE_618_length_8174_cov_41.665718_7_plen_98_part_00